MRIAAPATREPHNNFEYEDKEPLKSRAGSRYTSDFLSEVFTV